MEQLQSFLTYLIIFALAIGVYASLLSLRFRQEKQKEANQNLKFIKKTDFGLLYERPDGSQVHIETIPERMF